MWRKNRKQRDKRIKRQQKEKYRAFKEVNSLPKENQKENQSDFVEQIKCQSENYRFLNSQKHNNLIEHEKQSQLAYHKQINS